ncbi:MAG: hypothetical protein OEW58_04840 [Gammaproteobacteria bacterium]|nr:hypothetical protein [Gammaproteobacteria bacterium]
MLIVLTGWSVPATAQEDLDQGMQSDLAGSLDEKSTSGFSWGGYLRNETAYRYDEPRTFTKIRNTFSLNLAYDFGSSARLYAAGWYYYDHVYDLFNYETIAARTRRDEKETLVFIETLKHEKDSDVTDLRELYLDLYLPSMDVRIGRQFVVWGVIEGIRVVDEINPMDFRELILPELLDYRIPLWTLKVDYYLEQGALQFLYIPDLTFHKPAPGGSEWELFQVLDKTTLPENGRPEFAEYGLRWSGNVWDADVSLSYFYTWDDYPTTFRVISDADVQTADPTTELAILPTYKRMAMYGSTLTKEIGGNIVKAELVYATGKYFAVVDEDQDGDGFLDADGEIERPHWRWALGYDFSWGGADFSPAIAQWIITNYNNYILTDEVDTTFNLFIRKPMQRYSSVFTLLGIYLWNFEEVYLKPKFTFNLTNNFQIMAGVDYFAGIRTQFGRAADTTAEGGLIDLEQRAQFLGNFRDNNRIFVEFKYSF